MSVSETSGAEFDDELHCFVDSQEGKDGVGALCVCLFGTRK